MNLLEFFFIISWIVILVITFDIARKQKFNALHFLIFIGVGSWLLILSFFPQILQFIWDIFGVARWADVLVYISIIFLLYFVLLLLTKHVENRETITKIIRHDSIKNSLKKEINWEEVFLIRSYNEATVISDVIESILKEWYKNILVVNDWSTDNTLEVLDKFWDKINVISHSINRWAWSALETGFEYIRIYAKVKYIVTFDADGQHDISDYKNFAFEFAKDEKLWVVLGSRFIQKTDSNVPFIRKMTLFLWRIFTLFVSWIYLTDAHNWYRVFTFDSIKKIKLNIEGMAYASELIEEIKRNKIKLKEVPVNIKYTDYSMKKWQWSWNAISIALRIIWSKFFR